MPCIGDVTTDTCTPCGKTIEFTLTQPQAGSAPSWLGELHPCYEPFDETDPEMIAILDAARAEGGDAAVAVARAELSSPTKEPRVPLLDECEGVWSEVQEAAFVARRGFDPEHDPRRTPADTVSWADPHITCVMPTTAKRLWCITRSIHCFLKQSYADRDLLIVSDGDGEAAIAGAIYKALGLKYGAACHRVRHVHLSGERSLGTKYNEAIALASGPYVALWADDDWHSPVRLEVVMRAMQAARKPIGGTNTMLAYRLEDRQAFMYWNPPLKPYLIGGTIVFHKKRWEACGGFPDWRRGSDSEFAKRMLFPVQDGAWREWAVVNDPRIYVAFVHGDNTGNPLGAEDKRYDDHDVWVKLEGMEADMRRYLKEDSAAFGF